MFSFRSPGLYLRFAQFCLQAPVTKVAMDEFMSTEDMIQWLDDKGFGEDIQEEFKGM